MKTRTIAILAIAAILVVGGVYAIAQRTVDTTEMGMGMNRGGGRGMHGKMHGDGVMIGLRQLNLSEEQRTKVKEIVDANKAALQPIREAMKTNHEKLAALKGNFDEPQVTEVANAQGDLMAQMIVAKQRVKSQIFAILTDEQKAKAEQFMQERKQRFGGRMRGWLGGQANETVAE